tara:strand:+ start:641 stop:1309 length:669 start_codon:yes stop_codon:yes gene_type:complete
MNFVESIYQETENIQKAIMAHPFTTGIGNGTLEKESFKFFIEQDYLFLLEYSKILALATAKSPNYSTMSSFSKLLEETLNSEILLHIGYCKKLGITLEDLQTTQPAPAMESYTNFLVKIAYEGEFSEIIAALLPCMLTYAEIGLELKQNNIENNDPLYNEWIEMYSDPEFVDLAHWLRDLVNTIASHSSQSQIKKMKKAYIDSCRFELEFWTMSLNKTTWLV